MFKALLRHLLRLLYKVEVKGIEHLKSSDQPTLIVANHTSFLDAVLIYAFMPARTTFAINTYVAHSWIGRLASLFCVLFAMDPANPLSMRRLIRRVQQGGCVVIFPEGRITVTGALMKIYQ
ncbi:MAG: 1-acyl-sn-glycerol-3-phosphate acyltransferase, partial [Gammaproteobacteria bacterium]|nr:1-acyl-sn-glycerol-3-phosphate acyltransferase [Gammaproteobacteria bacterium]